MGTGLELLIGFMGNLIADLGLRSIDDWTEPDTPADTVPGAQISEMGSPVAILTVKQCEDIQGFLDSSPVRSLIASTVLSRAIAQTPEHSQIEREAQGAFTELATMWSQDSGEEWSSLADLLWDRAMCHVRSALPSIQLVAALADQDVQQLLVNPWQPDELQESGRPMSVHLRELISILGDGNKLRRARRLCEDLQAGVSSQYSEINLQHLADDQRFKQEELYVSRNLVMAGSRAQGDSDEALALGNLSMRAVVIGDPGVGKSTLVRHFIHETARISSPSRAPLLYRCREFQGSQQDQILNLVARAAAADYHLTVEPADLNSLLTLGAAVVVFDGVDEVTDIVKRRELTRSIEQFSRRFPLVQVLATTRKVGYSRAVFDDSRFSLFELEEFDDAQFREYVCKWFSLSRQSDLDADGFLRESESVADIRCNPLMLSLLCTLYRARGYLPRNRWRVYGDCADLLFRRWDGMRKIEQPFDHKHYGEKMMQELAFFFFFTHSARQGVEEGQLKRIIAAFLRDTAGVEHEDSIRRAESFLDFCADRAWLLSARGTSAGDERLFAFTHQTFMEYFAAAAAVRRSGSMDEVVKKIHMTFSDNPSSLISDLMIQCAEDKYENAAETLIAKLNMSALGTSEVYGGYLSLALRTMNATPLKARTYAKVLESVFDHWESSSPEDSRHELGILLELYREPRRKLDEMLGRGVSAAEDNRLSGRRRSLLAVRWARLSLIGESGSFENEWGEFIDAHLSAHDELLSESVTGLYAIDRGIKHWAEVLPHMKNGLAVATRAFREPVMGLPLRLLSELMSGEERLNNQECVEWMSESLIPGDSKGHLSLDLSQGRTILDAIADPVSTWKGVKAIQWSLLGRPIWARNIVLWLRCLLAEIPLDVPHPLALRNDLLFGVDDFSKISRIRYEVVSKERSKASVGPDELGKDYPKWFGSWVRADYWILRDSPRQQGWMGGGRREVSVSRSK